MCECAYCRAGGMSKSAVECVDRMVEVSKRLKAFNKNINRDTVREMQLDEKRLEDKNDGS